MKKLTKEQAAIIGAFTGISCGPFDEVHEYVEKIFGRPVFTHEMGSPEFATKVKHLAMHDFLSICREEEQ